MDKKPLSDLTDQELLQEAKKRKSAAITNAFLIGFLIGIVFYSVIKNTWGFLTLIPLFLAYKLINNSKYEKEELENLLKERGLK
ncbi:FUSC family protein [Flavobacterium sp. MMLR14_040]|uniref:FUSC family protein n=1 Tax=Flavobacterium sp. MMLR14_040 TaxID=3093843 RepID=UPI0029907178|nr:FUSC family protein [Flavobacterium sp. MMLR14_040]MDW8849406.1 FUSC family protein [Flavobacterium sp. MMLR14_040]